MPRAKKQVPKNKESLPATKKKKPAKKAPSKRVKAERTRNAGTWTEAEFWQNIRSALRQKSRFWKPRMKCLEVARRPNQSANKRLKWEFICQMCKGWYPQTQVEAHHMIEAGSLKSGADLEGFVSRLFAEEGWICVCRSCHREIHNK